MSRYVEPIVYAQLFERDAGGAAILEELVRLFARPAVSDGGIEAILKTYERAGQRKVLDFIMSKINQANGVPDDATE